MIVGLPVSTFSCVVGTLVLIFILLALWGLRFGEVS